jgi:hypothetical protein
MKEVKGIKDLQILAKYIEKTYSKSLFSDPDSLILYLNTHDFIAKEITLADLSYALKNPLLGTLSDTQKGIIDRYAAFFMPQSQSPPQNPIPSQTLSLPQSMNSLSNQSLNQSMSAQKANPQTNQSNQPNQSNQQKDSLSQKLELMQAQSQIQAQTQLAGTNGIAFSQNAQVVQPLGAHQVHQMLNPYVVMEQELDVIAKKRQELLEKEKQLLQLQQALDVKEEVMLSKKVTPTIQKFVEQFDGKISHYKALLGQYQSHAKEFERSEQERDQQYQALAIDIVSLSRDKRRLEGDVTKLARQLEQLSTQLIKSTNLLEEKEKQIKILGEESERISEHLLNRQALLDRKEAELADLTSEAKELHTSAVRLKEEYIQKQKDLRVHEAQLVRTYDSIEHLLKQKYEKRLQELEDHYSRKLQELTHVAEEQAIKLQHLERKEEMILRKEKELQVLRGEAELIKNQNQQAHHNLLRTVDSITKIAHANQRDSLVGESPAIHKLTQLSDEISDVPVIESTISESSIESGSSQVKSVEVLYNIASKEVAINPHLAYKTYKKLHHLYTTLSVPQKTEWYPKLVRLHMKIIEHGKGLRQSTN